jgi:hypothetical protein
MKSAYLASFVPIAADTPRSDRQHRGIISQASLVNWVPPWFSKVLNRFLKKLIFKLLKSLAKTALK